MSFILFLPACVLFKTYCCIFIQVNLILKLQFSIPSNYTGCLRDMQMLLSSCHYFHLCHVPFTLIVSYYKLVLLKHSVHVQVLKNEDKGDGGQLVSFVTEQFSMQAFSCYGNLQLMEVSSKPYFSTTFYSYLY